MLAARAGATYVSPFLGRLDDISVRGTDLIAEIAEIFAILLTKSVRCDINYFIVLMR